MSAVRPVGMPPVRAGHITPPLEKIVQRHGFLRGREDRGAGHQIFRRRGGKLLLRRRDLGDRPVAGGLDEFRKLRVGHIVLVHPETVHIDAMDRAARPASLPMLRKRLRRRLHPIENSPPGIHTMPSGAGSDGFVAFGIVGPKAEVPPAAGDAGSAVRRRSQAMVARMTARKMRT